MMTTAGDLRENNIRKIRKHMSKTYRYIRLGIAVIGFGLPIALFIVGKITGIDLQNSMSDYYHQGDWVRNIFVGSLWVIAVTLVLYKGFSSEEDWVLNLAGCFAFCVAMFPARQCTEECSAFSWHGFSAVALFLCMAYVCIRCQEQTLKLLEDDEARKNYQKWYSIFAIAMIISPLVAFLFISILNKPSSYIFFVEVAGIYAFAGYWLAKTLEIRTTEKEILKVEDEKQPVMTASE